ncbi:hypothetical protein [Peribacillus sp. NPDC097895]|uniref:hypothetical protein n=1 Tax=Peribacillus sp. NPDC097895 TaxID=3390619 RepID=UPI003D001777
MKQLNKFQNEFDDFDSKHLDTSKKNAGFSIKLQIEQLQTEINWAEEIKKDVNYDKSSK